MDYSSRKKPDVSQALGDLKKLQGEFDAAANDNRRKADEIGNAVKALEAAKARDEAHEAARFRDRIAVKAAYIEGLLAHEKKDHEFFVFVDHTGSITEKTLNAALDGAAVLVKGAGAGVALWGSMDDVRPVKDDILDPAVRKGFVKKGASSDFKPVVDDMIKTSALNQANGKPTHFVVIGDGEFADYPKAKAQMEKLLKGRYRATVDFVIFARPDTGMEFLSEQLAKDFPGRVKHHLINGPAYWQGTEADLSQAVQDTVAKVATDRILPAPKPAPQPQVQPAAAPKPPQP
jgi:hypothetical protein